MGDLRTAISNHGGGFVSAKSHRWSNIRSSRLKITWRWDPNELLEDHKSFLLLQVIAGVRRLEPGSADRTSEEVELLRFLWIQTMHFHTAGRRRWTSWAHGRGRRGRFYQTSGETFKHVLFMWSVSCAHQPLRNGSSSTRSRTHTGQNVAVILDSI